MERGGQGHGSDLLKVQERVVAACERYESAWRSGAAMDIEAFLSDVPEPERSNLRRELAALDEELRGACAEGRLLGNVPGGPVPGLRFDPAHHRPAFAPRVLVAGERIGYFGDYEILVELGRGGMGVVYKARQVSVNRLVALKLVKWGHDLDDDRLLRFRNETEAVAALDHPNVVPIFEVGQHEGQPYFTMKFLGGGSVAHRLHSYASDPRTAAALIIPVAEAVYHAHCRGILHRDLKPANILLDEQGRPYVGDFGLAKRLESDDELTLSQEVLGTPAFMASEQADRNLGPVTTATDVYGLGAVLYAMLTGRPAFRGETVLETLRMVREASPLPPSRLNPRVARDLETICLKCLHKQPVDRYGSAEAVALDLKRYLAGEPIAARSVGVATRFGMWCRRRPAQAALALTLSLGLAATSVAATVAAHQAELRSLAAREAATQTYYARLSQTAARRHEPRAGWSWLAINALAEAARLETPARSLPELKSEAAACLTAFDIRPVGVIDTGFNASLLAFSPDGRILAVAEFKVQSYVCGRVQLINTADGKVMATLFFTGSPLRFFQKGNQEASTTLRFSPDGQKLALGTRAGWVWLWDRSHPGDWSTSWAAHGGVVEGLAFDPAAHWLWTASSDGTVKRWDLSKGGPKGPAAAKSAPLPEGARDLAIGQDSLWISLRSDSVVRLDPMTLTPKGPSIHLGYKLGVRPDGSMVAGAAGDHVDLAGAAERGVPIRSLVKRTDEAETPPEVHSVHFGRRGTLLAGFYDDRHVKVWDVASGRQVAHFPVGGDGIGCAAFSPDGNRLAVTDHYRVMIYEIRADDAMHVTASDPDRVYDIAWSPGDRRLAWIAVRADRSQAVVVVWDDAARRLTAGTQNRPGPNRFDRPSVAVHPFGPTLAFHAWGQTYLWSGDTAAAPTLLATEFDGALSFSPDGARLWGVAANDGVDSWSLDHRTRATAWKSSATFISGMSGFNDLAVGRHWVAAAGHDGRVTLFDARDGSAITSWNHTPAEVGTSWKTAVDPVRRVDFTGDETLMASGTQSGRVWIRRLPAGDVVACLEGHGDSVEAMAFHPGGRLLASGARDGTIRFWSYSTQEGHWEWEFTLPLPGGTVHRLGFSPDGEHLAILIDNDRAARILDLASLRRQWAELGIDR
jgi:WD40 repeat protein